MRVETLRLHAFRAHRTTTLAFAPKVNVLVGPNGVGKTNVLEALHYLALTKSMLAGSERYAVRQGEPFLEVEAQVQSERRGALRIRFAYVPGEGKRVLVNGAPVERLADHIGTIPLVLVAPDDYKLTSEGPEERRRFLDNILSQAQPVYLNVLMQYRRTLRQRNELLMQYRKRGGPPAGVQASWDAELALLGSQIVHRRLRFVAKFSRYLAEAHAKIGDVAEKPTLRYRTFAPLEIDAERDDVNTAFHAAIEEASPRETEQGRTLVGPHRDELVFKLDRFEVRRYASQGQHRTFGLALKLAQFAYLRDTLEETPLLLLDDLFGILDDARANAVLDVLESNHVGQSFITDTQPERFERLVGEGRGNLRLSVRSEPADGLPAATVEEVDG
jgi:DNA replication and repair protein RecF